MSQLLSNLVQLSDEYIWSAWGFGGFDTFKDRNLLQLRCVCERLDFLLGGWPGSELGSTHFSTANHAAARFLGCVYVTPKDVIPIQDAVDESMGALFDTLNLAPTNQIATTEAGVISVACFHPCDVEHSFSLTCSEGLPQKV